ncbi:uncharacterized protein LOC118646731 [Monomorium pharaonis]|uniref:uncharacterized protein LOC118646731 n=1 Tax=Monomorium pharaonis TaxID=307658 RepID=UPI0017479314|nr:uncharacterized protein LOC118646731 [Monomorium pharaonis]
MSYFPYFASGRGHLVTPPFLSSPPCIPLANVRLPPPPSLPPRNPRSPSSYPLWKMRLPTPFAPPPLYTILTYPLQLKETWKDAKAQRLENRGGPDNSDGRNRKA